MIADGTRLAKRGPADQADRRDVRRQASRRRRGGRRTPRIGRRAAPAARGRLSVTDGPPSRLRSARQGRTPPSRSALRVVAR